MNVLFVHHNFPAQFRHIAADLAARPNCSVAAIGSNSARALPDVRLVKYDLSAQPVTSHPFARRFDLECRRAEQVLYAATELAAKGFRPDVIVVHSGWGENLPLRAVFPQAKIIVYSEFYYRAEGLDVNFDPEFPQLGVDAIAAMQIRNASQLLGLADGDHGLSPTEWQRSTFPTELRAKIKVIHEGIDVDLAAPKEDATVTLADGNRLGCSDEIVTYVSRNLEPLRGYHIFMRALPEILKRRPKAQVLIVGGTRSSYGPPPPSGTTWKEIFLSEVREFIDLKRVHFLGNIAHDEYIRVLQISSAHVYFTYPFVLSWSLLEAMSVGCAIVASDTGPVREVVDGRNGLLIGFREVDALAQAIVDLLKAPRHLNAMRKRARETVLTRFDLRKLCLPAMANFIMDGV